MDRLPPSKKLMLWLARRRYSWRVALAALHYAGSPWAAQPWPPRDWTWSEIEGRAVSRRNVEVALPSPLYWPTMRRGLRARLTGWPESFLPGRFRRLVESRRFARGTRG
ncbi:MAG: hypothetical protein IT562_10685 [Alphaproteobacteria bacterium]|nr:hypothetical protein [Alphaproteobacteria bacterium]